MIVHNPDKRYIGSVGKMRVSFKLRAQGAPVEIKIGREDRDLGVTNIQDDGLMAGDQRGAKILDGGPSHVHFKGENVIVAIQQAEGFGAGSGGNADFRVDSATLFYQQRGGAAGAVAGNFATATIGIPKLDGRVGTYFWIGCLT